MGKPKNFSIAVTGAGRLLAMFITEGMTRYPKATWYDRSGRANSAIEDEIQLGKKGFLRPADQQSWKKAEKNLRNPPPVDVTVSFTKSGEVETVAIMGNKKHATLLFKPATMKSLEVMRISVLQIVNMIGAVL